MKKILIIGEAGRGKTTLAEKISTKLNIPHYSTDDFFWKTKYTEPREKEIANQLANDKYNENEWIIEGTTQWLIRPGLDGSDIILFLNFKTIFHQWFYIIKRHFSRKNESLKSMLNLLRHVFYKRYKLGYKKDSITHRDLIEPYRDKVTELNSFKQIDNFVANL
jgi:adenylate kinase family enzyme